jgi:hypothetical protein
MVAIVPNGGSGLAPAGIGVDQRCAQFFFFSVISVRSMIKESRRSGQDQIHLKI